MATTSALDVVETIRSFNAGRDAERLAMKYAAMHRDPFTFLRGSCHLSCDRLAALGLDVGAPPAWCCGDLHLENFGSYQGDNRLVYFDIADFDESALAPAQWDVVRLLTSLLVGADTLSLKTGEAKALCRDALAAYAEALATGQARYLERDTAQGLVKRLLVDLRDRDHADWLDKRTERRKRRRRLRSDGKYALPVNERGRARAEALVRAFAATRDDPRFFEVLDVARRIAGTGSLGVERYAVLIRGKGGADGQRLLDVKQALPSALGRHAGIAQPDWHSDAHRIVAVETRMQALPPAFLAPIARRSKSYVLRAMQPSKDRVALDAPRVATTDLRRAVLDMARLLAWAQLRSAGRQGSATADALIDWGSARPRWQRALLDAARDCAKQTERDWRAYAGAFDRGAFKE
ncbi:DUF2252 family protein [Aquincola sp. S2]|uniref:DUF2252 family protein n=1 Tax=Pseudaquabacterium terrae TaxID=2732868 RepID=A0ABX2EBC9_9BURK|nr:DUF2252 family protein [Aquabacterium terrae]NRF65714.1 DUF2252 family protein [Aquabacterium terrae]